MSTTQRGFSLIEILVALLLMQIALLALVPMFVVATRSTTSAGDLGTVGVIATQRMELLRQTAFTALAAASDPIRMIALCSAQASRFPLLIKRLTAGRQGGKSPACHRSEI